MLIKYYHAVENRCWSYYRIDCVNLAIYCFLSKLLYLCPAFLINLIINQ